MDEFVRLYAGGWNESVTDEGDRAMRLLLLGLVAVVGLVIVYQLLTVLMKQYDKLVVIRCFTCLLTVIYVSRFAYRQLHIGLGL